MMINFKTILTTAIIWIKAGRPHTMGLSFAVIITGSLLVGYQNLHLDVLLLALVSAAGFQLISNFANDYGDFKKGTDTHRNETYRALSAGNLTEQQVKHAIIALSVTSLLAVIALVSLSAVSPLGKWVIFFLGIASVIAAMAYTLGKHPYGYYAIGDIMVFLFFGIIGVVGSFYLQGGNLARLDVWLIAIAFGALSTSVLNINNMRDSVTDISSGKTTIANILGKCAITYQYGLFTIAIVCFGLWCITNYTALIVLFVAVLLCLKISQTLKYSDKHSDYNQCLALTVKSTLIIGVLSGAVGFAA